LLKPLPTLTVPEAANPTPDDKLMSPDRELADSPDAMATAPEFPVAALPLATLTNPLSTPPSLDAKTKLPLEPL
jgi:hypothetical protein